MRAVVLLGCLTCNGQSRRVQRATNPETAFSPAGLGVRFPLGKASRGKLIGQIGRTVTQAEAILVRDHKLHRRTKALQLRAQARGQPRARGRGSKRIRSKRVATTAGLAPQQGVDVSTSQAAEVEQEYDGGSKPIRSNSVTKAAGNASQQAVDVSTSQAAEVEQAFVGLQKEDDCRYGFHIGVIGAGPVGMTTAAIAKARGYCVTLFEKQGGVGGDWRRWGNPWSKLQVHRDAYLIRSPNNIHVDGEDQLPLYPSRGHMLDYFQKYAEQTGIYRDIIFNATVTGRDGTTLFYEQDGRHKSATFSHIFAAPGRVNSRREIHFDSENTFRGQIACGSGGDLIGVNWRGKNVVIVGHGSFAIENARHALESGAAKIIMIARHEALVYPRVVSYALDWGNLEKGAPLIEEIHKMYAILDYPFSRLKNISKLPFMTMPPSSDIFFLAIAAGKLQVVNGEVAKLQEHCIVTKDGDAFPADVFIKCLGFKRDTKLDAELIQPGSGDIEERWIMNFVDEERRVYVGSCANAENLVYPNSSPPETEAEIFFQHVDYNPHIWREPGQWQDPWIFFADVQREWSYYCQLFGVNITYPYTEADIKAAFSLS